MGSRVSRRRGPGSSSESDDSDTDEEYRKEPSKYSSYWLDPACATWCRESRQQPRAPVASATANDDDDCVYAHCEPGDMDSTAQKSKPNVVDSTAQNTQTFDVVIVGAGMSGVSVAYYLRKKMNFTGTIAILDARGIAQHASGRNGGHCWPTANVPRMLHTFDALEKTAKELGVPFHCNGGLELLRQDADLEDYSARDLEYPCEYWDKHRIRKELPMLRRGKFKHGVFQTKAAHMSTPAFVNALFGSIADSVAFVQTRVTAINLATSSLHLGSGNQQIQAKHIVLATNAFTSHLLTGVPIEPVRGQSLHLEVTDPTVVLPSMALSVNDSFEYVQRVGERGLVYGGLRLNLEERGIEDDSQVNPDLSDRMRWRLFRTLNLSPTQYTVTHEWTGIMGFTPDEEPIVGHIPGWPHHFLICGFSGEGVIKGFCAARLIAKLVLSQIETLALTKQDSPVHAHTHSSFETTRDLIPLRWRPDRLIVPKTYFSSGEDSDIGKRTVRHAREKARRHGLIE